MLGLNKAAQKRLVYAVRSRQHEGLAPSEFQVKIGIHKRVEKDGILRSTQKELYVYVTQARTDALGNLFKLFWGHIIDLNSPPDSQQEVAPRQPSESMRTQSTN